MIYEILLELLKKHFYLVFNEKFKNETETHFIERYVAKHPLLKPELIVVNDQIHGFKKTNDRVASLEKFPIYLEVEYSQSMDGEKFVENVDLYAEAKIKGKDRLSDIMYLANIYSKTIILERVLRINDPGSESLLVYSKINELFSEDYLELDYDENLINDDEISLMIEVGLASFVNFLKILDDILVKGKRISKIDQIFRP